MMGFGSSLYRSLCYCVDSWFLHDKVKRAVVGSPPVCTLLGGCWAPGSGSGLTWWRWLSACGGTLPGAKGRTPCTASVWLALPECHMPRFNMLSVFQRPMDPLEALAPLSSLCGLTSTWALILLSCGGGRTEVACCPSAIVSFGSSVKIFLNTGMKSC